MKGTELEQYSKHQRKKGGKASYSSSSQFQGTANLGEVETRGVVAKSRFSSLPKWKADSLSFRQAMRMAKAVSLAEKQSKATGVPLHMLLPANKSMGPRQQGSNSKSYASGQSNGGSGSSNIGYEDFSDGYGYGAVDPSFIKCPHCGRHFNQRAGERHIPQVVKYCIT